MDEWVEIVDFVLVSAEEVIGEFSREQHEQLGLLEIETL